MKCLPLFCTVLAFAIATTSGCKKQDEAKVQAGDPNDVVASVDDVKLLRSEVDKVFEAVTASRPIPPEQAEEMRANFDQRFVNSFVMKTLLINEAKKEGLAVTDEERQKNIARVNEQLGNQGTTFDEYAKSSPLGEAAVRKEFEEGMLIEKLLQAKILDPITIDDAEVEKVIESIKGQNAATEEANAKSESNDAKRTKIDELKKQLDSGADFAELAKANSSCPSAERGGDLGSFQRGMMVPQFDAAVFAQEVGKVGDVVETMFGYHLILVTAKTPATEAIGDLPATPETVTASHILIGFDRKQEVQPIPEASEIRDHLKQQQAQPLIQDFLEGLKAKAKIESTIPYE